MMNRPDLCLEFVNTRFWRGQAEPTETLKAPEVLGVDRRQWRAAAGQAAGAARIRAGDRAARDAAPPVRRRGAGQGAGHAGPCGAERSTSGGARAHRAQARARRLWLGCRREIGTALALLAPVLWSAGDLLAGSRLDRVRRCANPECGWLFLDDSRAGKRRWCSMSSCGNRAKARRHYHRSREQ